MSSTIQIQSQEGTVYNLDSSSLDSQTFKRFIDRVDQLKNLQNIVVLSHIPSSTIERIVAYLLHNSKDAQLGSWNKDFVKKLTGNELVDTVSASDHLHLDGLVELGRHRLTKLVDKKSVASIRKILAVPSNFSQEEEDFVEEDCKWEEII